MGERTYVREAMAGKDALSDVLIGRVSHNPVLCAAVPIVRNEKVVGVICASIRVDDFKGMSRTPIFEGAGEIYITTRTGDLIIGNKNTSELSLGDNVFLYFSKSAQKEKLDTKPMIADFSLGKEGSFPYYDKGESYYTYYAPLGVNEWYVLCTVPAKVIDEQTDSLRKMSFWLSVGLLIAFLLILTFVMLAGKESKELLRERNRELEINEHRFRMASSLSNNVVIEWNILDREMVFLDGNENIAAEPLLKDYPESAVEKGYIHPESAEAFLKMHKDIYGGSNLISGEFKMLAKNRRYSWCRIDELLFFDPNGNPVKAIGRITDIDKERAVIEHLQSKAKLDSGTGLYNKEATRLLTEDCLKQDPGSRHALLIVDFDDFKDINDNRGHIEGDRILVNTANLMKELFRSSDIIGRIGGDEFMIFVRSISDELFLESKVKTLCERVEQQSGATLSVGIARYPYDGKDYISLYRCADMAMYEAKARGKGTFAFYNC